MNPQELDEYRKAFNGDEVSDKSKDAIQSDETPEGDSDTAAVEIVIDPVRAVDDVAESVGLPTSEDIKAAESAPQTDGEMAAQSPVDQDTIEEEVSPEDLQRKKSWEGRLRKREEELAAREAALQQQPVKLAEGGEAQMTEINDAEIAEIQQKLADDFGDEFVQMIMKLAGYEAQKLAGSAVEAKIAPINETISQAIDEVSSAFQSMHFSAIAEAYEDFQEIIASPEFQQFVESMPEEQKAQAVQVMESGTAKQVIGLLAAFKQSIEAEGKANNPVEDGEEDPALEAAEGVRGSAPVTLPSRAPVNDDDEYRAAWATM